MTFPSLSALAARAGVPLPGASPPPAPATFQASEPGGASAPLIVLAVILICIVAGLWVAAGFFGLRAAVAFCSNLAATAMVVGILVPLIGLLLNYRSRNKEAAASVARAVAQAQGPQQAPASAVGVANQVTVETTKP